MPRWKISLDSSSTTFFYDPSFHCRSFCWLRSLVDKFFIIITANFSISGCCYLAYPLIHMTVFSSLFLDLLSSNFSFFLLHFFSVFDRCIFPLFVMPRRKILLDSSSTALFYDHSFHCRSFCWLRSLVDKFFVIITANFSISGCCYLAYPLIRSIWPFFLLSSSIFFRQTFLSSCCIFFSLRSLHFSLIRDASPKNSSWFLFNSAFLWSFLPLSFFLLIAIPRR